MGQWTWPICYACWRAKNPGRDGFFGMLGAPREVCGWCGKETESGIYVRADPATVPFTRGVVK